MTHFFRIIALILSLTALSAAASTSDFPRPAELEPDIGFWVTVFTEYTSDQGVLHDNANLAVVYEHLDIPAGVSYAFAGSYENQVRSEKKLMVGTFGATKLKAI